MPEHSPLGQKLIESLEQAIAHQRGTYAPPRAHRVALTARRASVPEPPRYDAKRIRGIRQHLALSQDVFADALGVSARTIQAWEQGDRIPAGASRRLLQIAEEHPNVLTDKVVGRRYSPSRTQQGRDSIQFTPTSNVPFDGAARRGRTHAGTLAL